MGLGLKVISAVTALIILISIIPVIEIPYCSAEVSDPSLLSSHNPISINGNNEFNTTNGISAGSGTKNDPYIIQNLSIEITTKPGISIKNTDSFFIIRNCEIYNKSGVENHVYPFYFMNVSNGRIENVKLNDSGRAFGIFTGNNLVFKNNTCERMEINNVDNGMIINNTCVKPVKGGWDCIRLRYSENFTIVDNKCRNAGWHGIGLHDSSKNNIVENNTCFNNGWAGIAIDGTFSNNNSVSNNTCNSNGYGILLSNGAYNSIFNNNCSNNLRGIYLTNGNNNSVFNNDFNHSTLEGLLLDYYSDHNRIENNYFNHNQLGGSSWHHTNNNKILNNSFSYNNRSGYYLDFYCYKNKFIGNSFIDNNQSGILIEYKSNKNLIYNNYFKNKVNYEIIDSPNNFWNISKTSGKNILGGLLLGGNYWSNYSGVDKNGDGIGDTDLPYGPGDYLPLKGSISYPGLSDKTEGSPKTDSKFEFKAIAWSNYGISRVYLEFKFDTGSIQNYTMIIISGDSEMGTYSLSVSIPIDAEIIYYKFSVVDQNGYWNSITPLPIDVIDNINPTVAPGKYPWPTTGDDCKVKVYAYDNIEISNVYMEYWFFNDTHFNRTLTKEDLNYTTTIEVPSNAVTITFNLSAVDTSNNWGTYGTVIWNVTDNDPPSADAGPDLTVEMGEFATFDGRASTDNIGIFEYYWTFDYDGKIIQLYGSVVEFKFEIPGLYNVTLRVGDVGWNFNFDTVKVNVTINSVPEIYLMFPVNEMITSLESIRLSWYINESYANYTLFDLYFDTSQDPELYESNISAMEYIVENLKDSRYYWTVRPKIGQLVGEPAPVWAFTNELPLVFHEINISSNQNHLEIPAGNSSSVTITVKNLAFIEDTVEMDIEQPRTIGKLSLSENIFDLDSRSSKEIILTINTAVNTTTGIYKIVITAVSLGAQYIDEDVKDSVTISVLITEPDENVDTDNDTLPDEWEREYFENITKYDADDDPDNDSKPNYAEYIFGSDPTKYEEDFDGDGLPDKWEMEHFDDIYRFEGNDDPDGDGRTNFDELIDETDPIKPDSPKSDTGTSSDQKNLTMLLLGAFATVIIVLILLFFFITLLKKRRLEKEEAEDEIIQELSDAPQAPYDEITEPQEQEVEKPEEELIGFPQKEAKGGDPSALPISTKICSVCGGDLHYIPEYKKYFCYHCNEYE